MDGETLSSTYDHFRQWLKTNKDTFRRCHNPNIDTRAFADLNKNLHGATHMCIILEGVSEANEGLFREIKKYEDGTELKTIQKTTGDGSVYAAYVPYYFDAKNNNNNNNNYFVRYNKGSSRAHNNNNMSAVVYLYVIGLFLVIFLAFTKTNRSDWNFLFGHGK
jgi:hypothetical protein